MAKAPTYRMLITPLPDPKDPEGILRLRALLKMMLRTFRLRNDGLERVPEPTPPPVEPQSFETLARAMEVDS